MSYYAGKGNKYIQEPEEVIDFHGFTTSECKEELSKLILEKEYSHVRIIVGKGRNSPNGPVLPDFVKNYLFSHNVRYNVCKIQDGGEGALEVFLK